MIEPTDLPWIVDLMILFTLLEGSVLALYRLLRGRGIAAHDFLVNMLSGLCLMLALRALVRHDGALHIVLCLAASGVAHGADIWMRWRRARGADSVPMRPIGQVASTSR